jgi:ribosome biogenesis protein NSA1
MVNIVVGDETGLLKTINSDTGVVKSYGQQRRSHGVVKLVGNGSNTIKVIRTSGCVEEWEFDDDENILELTATVDSNIGNPVSATAVEDRVFVVNGDGDSTVVILDHEDEESQDFPHTNVDGPISTCLSNPFMKNLVALGGKERDLDLFDCEDKKVVWQAKNVPHDNLNLRVPIWITAIDILDANTIVTGTAYKHIRVYDVRTNQRPIKSFDLDSDFRVSALKLTEDSQIVVGDTGGNQYFFDFPSFRPLRTFKGATGSIRSIDIQNDMVVTGGLDRHVRVYRESCGTALHSFYLKNRITSLLCIGGNTDSNHEEESEASEDVVASMNDEESDSDQTS